MYGSPDGQNKEEERHMIQNPFFPEIHGNFGFGCMRLPMKDGQVDHDEFRHPSAAAESSVGL